ncbi:MAG: polyamine aminopropyltransferase [Desulfatitalea sp.]|nr:polyamine aminopropyltransferase [Desulfatitalea sp.]NNJ99948.1 polyamine aminopropyltransferase [Desulfatitalea sp.]
MSDFVEAFSSEYSQAFKVGEILFEEQTGQHHLVIFHNAVFGRVMALDGIIQTTEADEFIYHEMLAHVPLLAHGNAARVLIIGGGDGGILREVIRHAQVTSVTLVEIDQRVIDLSRRYLPHHSRGAFDDPRARVVIDDGLGWVLQTTDTFDVIICDSTDPIGPGEKLFQQDFYTACKRRLAKGGILATQNGVPFLQLDEVQATARRLKRLFGDWHFYTAAVPTYIGGIMTFGWASDDPAARRVDTATIQSRYERAGIVTRYYTPEIHHAAFALPKYILTAIGK